MLLPLCCLPLTVTVHHSPPLSLHHPLCSVIDSSLALQHPLVVTIEDFDIAGNDFMGQVKIPLISELTKSQPLRRWHKLGTRDGVMDTELGQLPECCYLLLSCLSAAA